VIGETVTLLRRGTSTRDAHGNRVWTYTETDVPGCAVWPTGSTEQIQGQDQTSERLTVWFPYGTTVNSTDRARVRGLLYEVDGLASAWASPFTGTRAGVEVRLVRVEG
jgi:head-tail adaptor